MTPIYSISYAFLLLFIIISVPKFAKSDTQIIKILPEQEQQTRSLLTPKPRINIPSSFAKNYWVSGTFFNSANFQGLPTSFYFTTPQCINYPSVKKSLKTEGCVMLFRDKDCAGTYTVVTDEDKAELGDEVVGMKIGSMKSCPGLDDSWRGGEGLLPKKDSNKKTNNKLKKGDDGDLD